MTSSSSPVLAPAALCAFSKHRRTLVSRRLPSKPSRVSSVERERRFWAGRVLDWVWEPPALLGVGPVWATCRGGGPPSLTLAAGAGAAAPFLPRPEGSDGPGGVLWSPIPTTTLDPPCAPEGAPRPFCPVPEGGAQLQAVSGLFRNVISWNP